MQGVKEPMENPKYPLLLYMPHLMHNGALDVSIVVWPEFVLMDDDTKQRAPVPTFPEPSIPALG